MMPLDATPMHLDSQQHMYSSNFHIDDNEANYSLAIGDSTTNNILNLVKPELRTRNEGAAFPAL